MKVLWVTEYLHRLGISPHTILINFKGKRILNLWWRNTTDTAVINWSKITSPLEIHSNIIYPMIRCTEKGITYVMLLPKIQDMNLLIRQTQIKVYSPNNRPELIKHVQIKKNKKGWEALLDWRRLRRHEY